jgi:hypothetical protein
LATERVAANEGDKRSSADHPEIVLQRLKVRALL